MDDVYKHTPYTKRVVRLPAGDRIQILNVVGNIHAEFKEDTLAYTLFLDACREQGVKLVEENRK